MSAMGTCLLLEATGTWTGGNRETGGEGEEQSSWEMKILAAVVMAYLEME